jgi:hypothetical protein
VSGDSPKGKRPRRERHVRKARAETISYIVEIEDWDWEFSFGVNTMKDKDDPYLDFRHLELHGTLLRPSIEQSTHWANGPLRNFVAFRHAGWASVADATFGVPRASLE